MPDGDVFDIFDDGITPVMVYDPRTGQSTYQPAAPARTPKKTTDDLVKEYGIYLMAGAVLLVLLAKR